MMNSEKILCDCSVCKLKRERGFLFFLGLGMGWLIGMSWGIVLAAVYLSKYGFN